MLTYPSPSRHSVAPRSFSYLATYRTNSQGSLGYQCTAGWRGSNQNTKEPPLRGRYYTLIKYWWPTCVWHVLLLICFQQGIPRPPRKARLTTPHDQLTAGNIKTLVPCRRAHLLVLKLSPKHLSLNWVPGVLGMSWVYLTRSKYSRIHSHTLPWRTDTASPLPWPMHRKQTIFL